MLKQPNMQPYNFYTFSTMLLNDLLSQYDFLNPKLIYIGCFIMASYKQFSRNKCNFILLIGFFFFF